MNPLSFCFALMMPAADTLPVRVAETQIETFNRRDLDGFMALYADDAVLAEFPSGKVLWRGKAAIRDRYAAMFNAPTRTEVRVPKQGAGFGPPPIRRHN